MAHLIQTNVPFITAAKPVTGKHKLVEALNRVAAEYGISAINRGDMALITNLYSETCYTVKVGGHPSMLLSVVTELARLGLID